MSVCESNTGVVINLDHRAIPESVCRTLWGEVERAMLAAGFVLDCRDFVAPEGADAADLARAVLKSLEPMFESIGVNRFDAIRDFYTYDLSTRVDLSVMDLAESIDVTELQT